MRRATQSKHLAVRPLFMNVEQPKNLGRFAWIRLKVDGLIAIGNVIDLVAGTARPKRIRIQGSGERRGEVVQPHEYEFCEWA